MRDEVKQLVIKKQVMKFNRKKGNEKAKKSKCCNYYQFKGFALFKIIDLILE